MYCHQEHCVFPRPPQQSESPTVEAAPKFGGEPTSSQMISPTPSTLTYPNAIGGSPSAMPKELSAATAADQLFGSAKSRKRPAHVMESAPPIPVLPVSPKRPPPSWFNVPPTTEAPRAFHLQPGPYSQVSASPTTYKPAPWIPPTRLSPTTTLRSEGKEGQGPPWDAPSQPQQFVSPSACHAKSPPTSQSPTSTSEGIKSSMNQPPPTNGAVTESQVNPNDRLPSSSATGRVPSTDPPPPDLLKSPWWSLTNATNEVTSLWETQQTRSNVPPPMIASAADRLSKMSVPRLDPFGTIRGNAGNMPLRLPGLPLSGETQTDRAFDYMLSATQQTPQLPPLRPPRAPHQGPYPADGVDDRCEVCWDNEETAVNPIIQCKGCGVKVHQQCYGVCRSEAEVDWFCALCLYWRTLGIATNWKPENGGSHGADDRPPPLLYCVLCNRPKGAMKTGSEGRWVHVSCVLYSQDGPTFRDVSTRSNPINIDKHLVTHNRNRYSCSICRSTEGYTTNCSFPGCLKRVHVACVFANGYRPKLQTITADVPLYPTAFLCQLPGSPAAEPTETRVVEKLVKIITCETHASENAYNAVELYEKKLLKKTDLSATASQAPPDSLLPPPLHPPYLPQATGDAACRPASGASVPPTDASAVVATAQTPSIMAPHAAPGVPPTRMTPQPPTTAQQSMWPAAAAQPMYQQYPPPASSYRLPNGMFVPGAGYPLTASSTTSPYYVHPWHVTPYGGYHAYRGGYGPQYGSMYPDVRTGQPGAYPNPYWPSAAYGSLLNRHHTGFSRVNGGGPRGACGINKSRTMMNRGEDVKSTPATSILPRKKETGDIRPVSGMAPSPTNRRIKASALRTKTETGSTSTSKLLKSAGGASLGPKQRKTEVSSPRTLDDENTRKSSVKTQRKKGSARGSSTTSGALASATQRKESKNRTSVSRRKVEEDDDVGTATGHVIGAALSTRGFRINWSKIDPHFRSLRHMADDTLMSSRICEKADDKLPLKSWSWILEDNSDSSGDGAFDAQAESTLNDLRSIWLDNCLQVPEHGPEAPLTVVVSAKVPKTSNETQKKSCEGAWTFWSMQEETSRDSGTTTPGGSDDMTDDPMDAEEPAPRPEESTPVRQASICEDSSSCHLTLSPSPFTKMRHQESSTTEKKKKVHLHLMQSYALSAKHIACLRQRQSLSRRDLYNASTRRSRGDESMTDCTSSSKMDTSLLDSMKKRSDKVTGSQSSDFARLIERVQIGHEDPTGSKQESARSLIEQPKRKVTVDMANWNEIQRIESHLIKRFPVPPFFVLLKKLPQEIGRTAASGAASAQTMTVQKFLAHRDSVAYTLDPAAPRRVVTASKKLYLHGRIWDLNPSFPFCETLFRSRLPEGSVSVSLPAFKELLQSFLSHPDKPPPIPIPDETTREWLASAQKVRLAASSQTETQLLTEHDRQTAAHGEDLIKILVSESYWRRLMFADDFVKRQALFSIMVWSKKHSRLNVLKEKISQVIKHEVHQSPRIADSEAAVDALKRQSDNASRWSAFRAALLAGHQDPGSALVSRVEAEHTTSAQLENTEGGTSTTGTASKIYFCLVCFGTELDNLNPLVTCARCGIKVHKNCYAIGQPAQLDLDIMEWYCDRCEVERKTTPEFRSGTCRCALCLRYGGALRRFQDQAFIHITCAVWASPLLVCGNLHKLSDWRFSSSHHVPSIARERICIFCARTQEHRNNQRRGARRRHPRDKVVRVSEDEEDPQTSSAESRFHISAGPIQETPELPLGTRGLAVKCAHGGCNECFHPLCAWLRGLRVVAVENYLESVASSPDEPFLPGILINAYCETHTPLYSPENRLPTDLISSHRFRAYLTREEQPQLTPALTVTAGEEQVTLQAPSSVDPSHTAESAAASPRMSHLEIAVPEHLSGGSRRPSINQELLQGILTSVADESGDDPPSTEIGAVLAEKDVYAENLCQACLENLDLTSESLLQCPECSVRVHSKCASGVFSNPDSVKRKTLHHICTSCRLGSSARCALCPRLGGALVEIPRQVVAMIKGRETSGTKAYVTAHKFCVMFRVRSEFEADVEPYLSRLTKTEDETEEWRRWLQPPENLDSSRKKECTICGVGSGALTACSEDMCTEVMHPLCAALAGLTRRNRTQSSQATASPPDEEEPATKKRRVVESQKYRSRCLEHVNLTYLEEQGVDPASLSEHQSLLELQQKLRTIATLAEAASERQRKQRELFEQYADNVVGFGLTRLDASYGISYDHTTKITQFLGQESVKNAGSTKAPTDEPTVKRATSSSATEAAPDSGSATEGGGVDAAEAATESPNVAVIEELTSDIGLASESRVPSTSEATNTASAERQPPPTTTGMSNTSEDEQKRSTVIVRSHQHTRRRSHDANIDDFPSQQPRVLVAPIDEEKQPDEAVEDVPAIVRHLDGGVVDVNHQLVSKESISQTTTASSTSDIGRRKRKRTIVDAESDDEDDLSGGGRERREMIPTCTPPSQTSSELLVKSPKTDLKSERKRTATPKHPPPTVSQRSRGKMLCSGARVSPPNQPKRRRVASLPLRNERGQFIRKTNQ